MKTFVSITLLLIGFVLLAGGNDWGLIGLVPAFFQMLKEETESETFETLD